MEIFKLAGIAVTTALLASVLKQYKSTLAIPVSMAGGILLLTLAMPYFRDFLAQAGTIAEKAGIRTVYIGALLKVIAIAFVTECTCALCRDAGMTALAAKLEMAGKLLILGLSMPVIGALFDTVLSILP